MSCRDLQEHSFVKVLHDFQYNTAEGREIVITKDEKLYLLQKTNADWWQVVRTWEQRSFYVPATYVREMSKTSRKISDEDKDPPAEPLDGPKYKNMPKETSSAMRNVKKWLASAIDSKHESIKVQNISDESHKHNAMDYAARAELKVGLAAIKTKSLERDHDQIDRNDNTRSRKQSTETQRKLLSGGNIDPNNAKASKYFSTSPKSFDIQSRVEMSMQDPFRKELESSLDRLRKKSDNTTDKSIRLMREQELYREERVRTKSSRSDDSHIDSESDEHFQPRLSQVSKKIDKAESKLSLSTREDSSSGRLSPNNPPNRNSRSLDSNVRQIGKRTERSLSPKPSYGRQLTIAEGEITDEELDHNTSGNHKILNDKRRTWAVEELMSELTQMCKERSHNKKTNFQLKSTEMKPTFDPLDELTRELHEMNILRSGGNTPQSETQPTDIKSTNILPSNVYKISIKSEKKIPELNTSSQSIQKHDEPGNVTEHSNISEASDISENSSIYRHIKSGKNSVFEFQTSEVILPQTKPAKSPKSPKILDEYNEANILNDCSPNDSLCNPGLLSHDKQSHYHNRMINEPSYSSSDNGHESPSYSNIKLQQIDKVKMRPKIQLKFENSPGELKLTPSLEKLASEIQFLPANRASYVYDDKKAILNECVSDGDTYGDSGKDDGTHKYDNSWGRKTIPTFIKYAGSFKTKREGRYFHRRGNSDQNDIEDEFDDDDDDDDEDDDDEDNDDDDDGYDNELIRHAKPCGLKKSCTLHYITVPDNYRRFRTCDDLASIRSKSLKRQSRSLSDLRCFEGGIVTEKTHDSPKSTKSKPVPLPRTKIPAIESVNSHANKFADGVAINVERSRVPVPRKTTPEKKLETFSNDSGRDELSKYSNKPMNQMIPGSEVNIESSTAVGFKTLLCTSESGSDNCLQSKDLLSPNTERNDDDSANRIQGKRAGSAAITKKDVTRTRESPSEEQVLSSNASSEALQSQSESDLTATFDASSQPSPVSARLATQDPYHRTVDLPPGWTQNYDLHTDQICFVNKHGDRWFSSNDDEGKIYFFEENSNESSWVLPTIRSDISQIKTPGFGDEDDSSNATNEFSQPQVTSSSISITNQSISRNVLTQKPGASPNDWPQLSFDGNMRLLKEGPISRTKITENGKKLRKNWSTSYAVLTELFLLFFKDSKTFSTMMKSGQSPIAKPDISVDLNGALVEPGETASSRKNVYKISTVLGLQVLIQSDNTALAAEWFQEIHGAIRKLPFGFKSQAKPFAGPPEVRRITNSKSSTETGQPEESKKSSKVARSRSMKMKRLDDSLEDLSGTVAERQTKIKAKLRRFFLRRPTVESLVKNGIYKDEPAFGSYLKDVCPTEYPRVPLFVKTCIEVLESNDDNMKTDGLYRASGNLSQIQKIRLQVDQYNLNVLSQEEDVHVLTGALKLFFRELKEPLIPSSFFEEALNASMLKKSSAKVQCFREIIKALPPPNHDTLQFLLKHLLKVTSYQEFNRMHIPNLAIVFGPTLMWPAEESANMALDLMQQNLVIECLLSEYNKIFK